MTAAFRPLLAFAAALGLAVLSSPVAAQNGSLRLPSGKCATAEVGNDDTLTFRSPPCFSGPDWQLSIWVTLKGMRLLIAGTNLCLAVANDAVVPIDCRDQRAFLWSKANAHVNGLTLTWDDSFQCLGRRREGEHEVLALMECNEWDDTEWK